MEHNNRIKQSISETDLLTKQKVLLFSAITRMLLSVIIMGVAAYVFVTSTSPEAKQFAAAMLGVVIGYWLR